MPRSHLTCRWLTAWASLLAVHVVAMTPPVCMDAGGLWGGGTLLSSCSGHCSGGVLCDVAVDGDYTCLNYTDSAFVLLIRNSGYVSDEDSAARVSDPNYVSTVAELPDDTGNYPHIDNCYLYDVAKLEIDAGIDQVVIVGGDTYRGFYKGRVGYLTFNSEFIANQSQITSVSLISLNLKDFVQDLPSKLPTSITQLDLKNTLTYTFPTQLTAFTKLEKLSLEGNYISTLNESDVIPTLKTLNLASNNITAMPASLANYGKLENLNLGSNNISEVTSLDGSDILTLLNLSDNRITTFEAAYPSLETLYLGGNNLAEIPPAVYKCTKLKNLYVSGSNSPLLSPVFTDEQFQFLQSLNTLDASENDFDTQAACQTNNTQQLRGTIQVCLTSAATATDAATVKSNAWKFILVAIAGGVVVLILLVVAICVWRRSRRAAKFITAELDDPQLAPLMLKPGDIKNLKKIGTGAHCVVWLVKYRKTQLLASKRLRKDLTRRRITKAFIEEIKMAAPLDHPSVVKLVGIAWTVKTDIQALFEYVDNGNVSDYLTRPGTLHEWTQQKLQIALEVAEALVYLHSFAPPVLHRDLRASNVLLTSGMKVKVSKVGVSHLRTIEDGDKGNQTVMGPWQAPEVLMGADDRDPALDIFSFGVLLSELDTHAPPYNDARSLSGTQLADAVVLQMIAAGSIRLRFGEDCPSDLRSLADSCLAKNPRMRPAASEVVYALRTIKKLV